MLAQANWTKASQLLAFLHQRVRTLRRLTSQAKVRSTTQRRGWKLRFTGHRAGVGLGLAAAPPVFDVLDIACPLDSLRAHRRSRSPCQRRKCCSEPGRLHGDMEDQVGDRPLVVLVGATDVDGQRRTPLIDQDVDLGAQFGAIGRVFARIAAAQGGGARAAVDRLPPPLDVAFARGRT